MTDIPVPAPFHCRTACAFALTLAGCASVHYSGDGVLTKAKAPVWFCQDQYDVDFGRVDFSVPTTAQFRISGLPREEYAVGFDVVASDAASVQDVSADRKPDPLIELGLENERGETVLRQRGRLSEWVWSWGRAAPETAFVYARGESTEVRVNATTTRSRPAGVGADAGWGTYFTPRRNGRYILSLEVAQADASGSSSRATLHVRGEVGCL